MLYVDYIPTTRSVLIKNSFKVIMNEDFLQVLEDVMDEEDMVVKEEDFLKVIKDAIVEEEKKVKEEADLNTGEVIGQNNGEDSPDYTEPVHRTQKPAEASLRFWMTFTTSKLSASMMMGRTLMAILTLF